MSVRNKRFIAAIPESDLVVEHQLRNLFPLDVEYVVVRMVSSMKDMPVRYRSYANLFVRHCQEQVGLMSCDAVLYCCSPSNYLLNDRDIALIRSKMATIFPETQVLFPLESIKLSFIKNNVKKIAFISQYDPWLVDKVTQYWQKEGIDVVSQVLLQNRKDKMILTDGKTEGPEAITNLLLDIDCDGVLVSGTCFYTLPLLSMIRKKGLYATSSTLALSKLGLGLMGKSINKDNNWGLMESHNSR